MNNPEKVTMAQSSVALKPSLLSRLRPETLADCFMPEDVSRRLLHIPDAKSIPHIVLHGPGGVGKTTIANLVLKYFDPANTYGMDAFFCEIRTSDFRGLVQFAVVRGFVPGPKVCLIEDADCLTHGQQLKIFDLISRNQSESCKFLLTAHSIRKIHHKLRTVMTVFSFEPDAANRAYEVEQLKSHILTKLRKAEVSFEQQRVESIVEVMFPDIRAIMMMINTFGLDLKNDWPF